MQTALLCLVMLGAVLFGYFVMFRLDRLLDENRKGIEDGEKAEEPTAVVLPGDAPDDEIIKEIHAFRDECRDVRIMIYRSGRDDPGRIPDVREKPGR